MHTAQDAFLGALGHAWLVFVFVGDGDVVKHVFVFAQHAIHAGVDNDRELIGISGIVGDAIGYGSRHEMTAAVLMLQTFAA